MVDGKMEEHNMGKFIVVHKYYLNIKEIYEYEYNMEKYINMNTT